MAADMTEKIVPYAHDQSEYAHAFETFITHTDQKKKTIEWLTGIVNGLRSHGLFVDAGAGEGSMTAVLAKLFDRTIAIEPNSTFGAELARLCPEAEIIQAPISEATIAFHVDFVLCSHVLYYIPQSDWADTLEQLTSWLGVDGAAVVLIGNFDADPIALIRAFFGKTIDIAPAVQKFKARHEDFEITTYSLKSEAVVDDLESACMLTRFFLSNYPDWDRTITKHQLAEYVQSHFTDPRGYRLSCDQDALVLRRR